MKVIHPTNVIWCSLLVVGILNGGCGGTETDPVEITQNSINKADAPTTDEASREREKLCSQSPALECTTFLSVDRFKGHEVDPYFILDSNKQKLSFSDWKHLNVSRRGDLIQEFFNDLVQDTEKYLDGKSGGFLVDNLNLNIPKGSPRIAGRQRKNCKVKTKSGDTITYDYCVVLDIEYLATGKITDVMTTVGHEWGHVLFELANPDCPYYPYPDRTENDPDFEQKHQLYYDQEAEVYARASGDQLASCLNPELSAINKAK